MTMTLCDFHHMTGLKCDGDIINLEGNSGTRLAINLLERSYSTDMIHYFDIKADYRPLPQETAEDCAQMARAFLLSCCTFKRHISLPMEGRPYP